MNKSVEKINNYYVLCGLDSAGTTVYLRSLHERGKWEITADVEKASKCENIFTAEMLQEIYDDEIGDAKWVIIPLEVEYRLIQCE